jgi:hypothetical protein
MIRPRSLDVPREESWAAHMQAGQQTVPVDESAADGRGGCTGDGRCEGCGGAQGGSSAALDALDWASRTFRTTPSPFWRIASTAQAVRDAAGRDESPDWIALDASLLAAHAVLAVATDGRNAPSAYAEVFRSDLLPPDEPTMGESSGEDGGGLGFPKQKPKAKEVSIDPAYNTKNTTSKPCCCKALGIWVAIKSIAPGTFFTPAKYAVNFVFEFEIALEAGGDCKLELWEYTDEVNTIGIQAGFGTKDVDGNPIQKKNTWSEVASFRGAPLVPPKKVTDPAEGRSLSDEVADTYASKKDECVPGKSSAKYTDTPAMGDGSYLYQVARWHSGCPNGGTAEVRTSIVGQDGGRFVLSPSGGQKHGEAGAPPPVGGTPAKVDPPPNYWTNGEARDSRFA